VDGKGDNLIRVERLRRTASDTLILIASLYRSLLGVALDDLPDPLRAFHDAPDAGRARGSFRVKRPAGRLARALGDLLGFPPASEDVTVVLKVEIQDQRERWVRTFGGHSLITVQEARGDHLVERVGVVRLIYSLAVVNRELVYDLIGARLLGVPIPRILRPVDRTVERGTDDGWEVAVKVAIPIFGEILWYGGRLRWERTPEEDVR